MKSVITIQNVWSFVNGITEEMADDLYEFLSFEKPGAAFVTIDGWDGKRHLFYKRNYRFLTGLTYKVYKRLEDHFGVKCKIIKKCKEHQKTLDYKWNHLVYPLRDYQKDIIKKCLKKKRAVIGAATGSGKTIVASRLIQKIGVSPFIFYVLTKDLLYQSKKRLEDSILGLEVGVIGDGICNIRDVNIMTVQTACRAFDIISQNKKENQELDIGQSNLKKLKSESMAHIENKEKRKKIKSLINNAKGIYADEIHHYASRICEKVLLLSPKAFFRYGGSATPIREDNAYLIIEGCFGRKTIEITASDLIKKGYLLQPHISFIPLSKNNRQYVDTMTQDREIHIVDNEERNDAIIQIAKKTREKGLSTLILIQTIDHGKDLLDRIDGAEFVYGSTAKKKRRDLLERFEKGDLKTLIASIIADEGIDLPILSVLIIAGGGKSQTRVKQRVGRVIRKGSPYSFVFDFQDIGRWTAKHSRIRRKILREESEFIVKTETVEKIIKKLNKVITPHNKLMGLLSSEP